MGLIAERIVDQLKFGFARSDLLVVITALATVADQGEYDSAAVTFSAMPNLAGCRQAVFEGGSRGIGLVAVFATGLPGNDPVVVLFVKEGRNLTHADRREVEATLSDEIARRTF